MGYRIETYRNRMGNGRLTYILLFWS